MGTRRLSPEGKQAALDFAYEAVNDGCNVVSGLAWGADTYAHRGALNAYYDAVEKGDAAVKGKTIAVLPSSVDEIVPYQNKKLAAQIIKSGGLLVSEYAPGVPVEKWHFVGRNRIIAGLSMATLVVEAPVGTISLLGLLKLMVVEFANLGRSVLLTTTVSKSQINADCFIF